MNEQSGGVSVEIERADPFADSPDCGADALLRADATARPSNDPAVTAVIVAYNHERYIAQALDSVLMQKTTFPYEVIVSEDRSTDSTMDVIQDFVDRYPDRIRVIRSDVNLGNNDVVTRALQLARGRYLTWLDGDDYWVSPDKLQSQFDFMEAHPDSAITYHDVARVTETGEVIRILKGTDKRATIDDLIQSNFVGIGGMIRAAALQDIPAWLRDMPAGDWPLCLLAARSGFIDYLEGPLAHYRIHGSSNWAARPLLEQSLLSLELLNDLEDHLGADYPQSFQRSRRNMMGRLREVSESAPSVAPVALDPEERLRQAEWTAKDATVRAYEAGIRVREVEALLAAATAAAAEKSETMETIHSALEARSKERADLHSEFLRKEAEWRHMFELAFEPMKSIDRALEARSKETADLRTEILQKEQEWRRMFEFAFHRLERMRRRERHTIIALCIPALILVAILLIAQWPGR
ncbi:hypothetical protein K32_08470 [Kaistia sp. 32K]|uniref:glycosyltransferase n=1 Tax=Kaistia sp. 32K TaxID=2795690 RepID=UPI001915700E|nr:glycosyltransferase [Kaistia sp. 32K]BCP52230.1 hypothetical protein K32_08470 [Kaistia sp. 32K]